MNLQKLYYNPLFPGSFGGVERFYREVKKIHPKVKKDTIALFLRSQPPYTLHKQYKRPQKFRKTLVYGPRDLWQIDLMDMQGYAKENRGFKYICIVIDCFTKFVWIKPLKSKTATQVVKSLSLLLMTERPNLLQADQGTEFFNKNFSKMLEAFGPKLYHTYSDKKASQVERVQRTIRQRLGRVFTLNSNNKWIDIIDDVINSYNNSFHRSIKMKPVDVKMEHVAILRHRLNYNGNIKPAKFKVGDKVRIIKKKKRFEKEYKPSWTDEIFIINKLNPTNPITYMLIDNNGENIIGSFYHEELQHVN